MPDNQYSIARKLLPGCGLAFLISHDALAVGFIISPPSQLTGMANAGSAVYDRSTASVNNNPAAMSLMNDMHVGGNLTAVIPDWSVNEGWDCKAENNCSKDPAATSSFIPTLGLVRPLGNDFTWGIGLGAIAGQGMDYGERFKTRPIVTKNELQVAGLMNALSWRMNEQWTFGASAGLIYGSVEQKQDLPSLSASAGATRHRESAAIAGQSGYGRWVPGRAPAVPGPLHAAPRAPVYPRPLLPGRESLPRMPG